MRFPCLQLPFIYISRLKSNLYECRSLLVHDKQAFHFEVVYITQKSISNKMLQMNIRELKKTCDLLFRTRSHF
jgi:hypothetical protein